MGLHGPPQAPEQVAYAHAAFVHAGADVITTNSYALVPYHIGEARFTKGMPRKPRRGCGTCCRQPEPRLAR